MSLQNLQIKFIKKKLYYNFLKKTYIFIFHIPKHASLLFRVFRYIKIKFQMSR